MHFKHWKLEIHSYGLLFKKTEIKCLGICNEKELLTAESKEGENMFCMWSKETFLRVRVRFVERRDALMLILASLDRDKNSSVSVASVLLLWQEESEVRLMVGLCFVRKFTSWACKWGETYRRTLFFFYVCFLFVKKVTNRACEWGENYGRTCLIFLFDDQLDLPVKETDRLYWCVQDFRSWQEGSES